MEQAQEVHVQINVQQVNIVQPEVQAVQTVQLEHIVPQGQEAVQPVEQVNIVQPEVQVVVI